MFCCAGDLVEHIALLAEVRRNVSEFYVYLIKAINNESSCSVSF